MLKRSVHQLAVYEIDKDMDTIQFACLRQLFLEKTSEIIYIIKEKKLYGIICMGEVLNSDHDGNVCINKNFTVLDEQDVIKAHKIFKKNLRINKIPIVNKQGQLIGDYSRWEDMLYIARCQERLMTEDAVKNILKIYETVYVIEPADIQDIQYKSLLNYLRAFEINFIMLTKEQIGKTLEEKAICIMLNEDERRGVQCLYHLVPAPYNEQGFNTFRYDKLEDNRWKVRLATYKSLLVQIMEETQLQRLEIKKPQNMPYERIDDKAEVLLTALQKKGIKCFCMYNEELEETTEWKKFKQETDERLQTNPISMKTPWSKGKGDGDFYDGLYHLEDYKNGTAQREIFNSNASYEYKKNICGKYFNAQNGRRITCFQPDVYIGTIHVLGLCIIGGRHVEDQYTIASYLQKKLLEKGYPYKVENYGYKLRVDAGIDSRLEEIGSLSPYDVVIYLSGLGVAANIEGISLQSIFEKYHIPDAWVMDMYSHCNHRANECIANEMMRMIEPCLVADESRKGNRDKHIDIHDVMKNYIQEKYLSHYFQNFNKKKYSSIGAIIMKGDPFSIGHRFLIKQARLQVDFLIIFVIEEDIFQFSFEERFRMIEEGVKDIPNVMVVPNGDFVFSKKTFWEYYREKEEEVALINAEYDINLFIEFVAGELGITHRFVGQNTKKRMVRIYNRVMREMLPCRGISYVEIPVMSQGDKEVCTMEIRRWLKCKEYDKAFKLLPETTKQFLMG